METSFESEVKIKRFPSKQMETAVISRPILWQSHREAVFKTAEKADKWDIINAYINKAAGRRNTNTSL